jgi:stearoyl-CoA desaturase (delta-9 desaturase)
MGLVKPDRIANDRRLSLISSAVQRKADPLTIFHCQLHDYWPSFCSMNNLVSIERIRVTPETTATDGAVRWVPAKSIWLICHGFLGLLGLIKFPQLDALLVFIGLTAVTICAGHSVGMHRLLIHRSFQTYRPVEYLLVWLGTFVGMAGPIGMIRAHDMRDWHQRQSVCPPHPAHNVGLRTDAWWQLCCEFRLIAPPKFNLETHIRQDRFYVFVERTWMLQQIPVAVILFILGGWAWVLWGCSLRIFVSLVGHWLVGHFTHRRGQQGWVIKELPVQGYNLPGLGLITFGENWHGNHHAFPHSAKLGIEPGQLDPGYYFIRAMEWFGIAWDIKTPASEPARQGLMRMDPTKT